MRKMLNFLGSLPLRFRFTSGFILLFLLVNAFIWFMVASIPKPGPGDPGISSGNAGLVLFLIAFAVNRLALIVGIIVFIAEVVFVVGKKKELKPSPYSVAFWVLVLLGIYPVLVMNEPWLQLREKTGKMMESVQYSVFSDATEKLKRDLDKDHTENVLSYLEQGVDINTQDSRGETALMDAIKRGEYGLATDLINKGADIHIKNNGGSDALSYALSVDSRHSIIEAPKPKPDRAKVALLLLDKGAKVKLPTDTECSTAVQGAVETGSIELVETLLKARLGVNGKGITKRHAPNYTESCGTTPPIFSAAEMGDNTMVSYLISKGANVNAVLDWDHVTPLMSAMQKQHPNTALLLISKGANVNAKDKDGNSVLSLALRYRMRNDVIKALLNAGAKVNVSGSYGQSPLTEAAGSGDFEKVKMMIAAGAKIDPKSKSGTRMLWSAILSNSPEAVRYFIKQDVDVDSISPRKTSMLFEAVDENDVEITKILLKAGANPNLPVPNKVPPLFQAIWENNPELVKVLLENGADVHAKGEVHAGPIEATITSPMSEKTLDIIKILISHGADVNQLDYYGNTALDVATSKYEALTKQGYPDNNLKAVIELLEHSKGVRARASSQ